MRKILPAVLGFAAFGIALWTLPALWCRQGSSDWFTGRESAQLPLAHTVAAQIKSSLSTSDFHTGNEVFNGEWLFGTYLMSGIGLCQIAQEHPGTLEQWRPEIEACIQQLLRPEVREFDRRSWQEDPLESLSGSNGHAAYLGYLNFLLGLYRQLDPSNRFAALNDDITSALVRRSNGSPNGLVATYPGEWYPVDNTPGLASIALHALATGTNASAFLAKQETLLRSRYIDHTTGLLIQAANSDGSARDVARGSGSTLGVFFLSRAYPGLSRAIFAGIQRHLVSGVFSFGAIREFPRGTQGHTDIDSGPVLFGFGFSATGFGIGGARACGDARLFGDLFASAVLAGAPARSGNQIDFLTAGPLGNAILLAMLTTPSLSP